MKSIYPKITNQEISSKTKSLILEVADTLRSGRGDKILETESVIRTFSKNNHQSLSLIKSQILEDINELSYISELHTDRIKWVISIIENYQYFQTQRTLQ